VTQTRHNPTERIFLRPIGIPLPVGVAGLAIASFVDSGLELHWVPSSQTLEVGVILASVPFTLQLIACVFSYLARDGAAGATLGILAATWLALGLIHITAPGKGVSGALGLLLLVSGGVVALSAVAVGTSKPLPAVVFLAAALRFELAGIHQLSASSPWEFASGILGLVVTGMAAYCALAFELESQNGAPRLPTFRRGGGATPIHDGTWAGLDRVEHEPGVRQAT
jgi:succinate-acetate transporter protein